MVEPKKSNVVYDNLPSKSSQLLSGVTFNPELKPEYVQKMQQKLEQDLTADDLESTLTNLFDFKSLKMEDNGLYSVDIKEIEELNLSKLFNENDIENDRLNLSTESLKNIDGNRLLKIVQEFAHDASKFSSDALDTIVEAMEDSMSNSDFAELVDRVLENNPELSQSMANNPNIEEFNQDDLSIVKENMDSIKADQKRQAAKPAISQVSKKPNGMTNG